MAKNQAATDDVRCSTREWKIGECVLINAGPYKGRQAQINQADKLHVKEQHEPAYIREPGEIIPQEITTCWVTIDVKCRHQTWRGYFEHKHVSVNLADLTPLPTAKQLQEQFEKLLKVLQKKCQHPDVKDSIQDHRVPAFYEMDSPDYRPEYETYDIYQCQVCKAYLKPNKLRNAKVPWTPGTEEGYSRGTTHH